MKVYHTLSSVIIAVIFSLLFRAKCTLGQSEINVLADEGIASTSPESDGAPAKKPIVWIAVGQTQEEVVSKCGEPSSWRGHNSTAMYFFIYDINFSVSYFKNNEDKNIVGNVRYNLPSQLSDNPDLAEPVIRNILEANADGQTWTETTESDNAAKYQRSFRRDGVSAFVMGTIVSVSLDSYSVFKEAERARIAAEQAERLMR